MTLSVEEIRKKYSDPERRLCKVHLDGYEEKTMRLTKAEIVELRHQGYRVTEQE